MQDVEVESYTVLLKWCIGSTARLVLRTIKYGYEIIQANDNRYGAKIRLLMCIPFRGRRRYANEESESSLSIQH